MGRWARIIGRILMFVEFGIENILREYCVVTANITSAVLGLILGWEKYCNCIQGFHFCSKPT